MQLYESQEFDRWLEKRVFPFFAAHITPTTPILLGLSGGPDSLFLLHCLLAWRTHHPFPLHIGHVDHGWREESASEAAFLRDLAAAHQVPFHMIRLSPTNKGNKEALAREERLAFFQKIAKEINASAVFLAHHQDDQVETVFKRFLEGANLLCLSGIQPVITLQGLVIMRPLLEVTKEEILYWLNKYEMAFFHDSTNDDTSFLRAKMRHLIFPFLRTHFGKEFEDNIADTAKEAYEMRLYFQKQAARFFKKKRVGKFGVLFDLSKEGPDCMVEARQFFHLLGEKYRFSLSREQVELLCSLFLSNSANKWVGTLQGKTMLYIDRRRVFLFADRKQLQETLPTETLLLQPGVQRFGNWQIELLPCTTHEERPKREDPPWLDSWNGVYQTYLPEGQYFAAQPVKTMRCAFSGKVLDKVLNEKKIPRVMATLCPMITDGKVVYEDCVSGMHTCCEALKFCVFRSVKASGFDDRKRVNIDNIDPFAIVEPRELSRSGKHKISTPHSISSQFYRLTLSCYSYYDNFL